ncbi:uncharacterized protein LAESUDRAFT_688012, partial [Laetiporus sulphureus 93-53]
MSSAAAPKSVAKARQGLKVHAQRPSSNWLALQKKLPSVPSKTPGEANKSSSLADVRSRKRRKLESDSVRSSPTAFSAGDTFPRGSSPSAPSLRSPPMTIPPNDLSTLNTRTSEPLSSLRAMIAGTLAVPASHTQPGKYLSLDCEMVGVGLEGAESALARVSLVNFHGVVLLDVFVRPKERVVDYRTQFSGIRPRDMVNAKSFEEAQKEVADLLEDRILVGHAVHNDLKALLLSHPRPYTRDTQIYAFRHNLTRSRRIALRHLVRQELGVVIQEGEHSSVIDARATMAVYRLHRREWEKGHSHKPSTGAKGKKRARADVEAEDDEKGDDERESMTDDTRSKASTSKKHRTNATEFPGGGRKGISSGLSVVVR